MKTNYERYFEVTCMSICDDIKKRLEKNFEDYQKKMFGVRFYLDIEFDNCITDLVYFRDVYLKTHLSLCRQNKLSKNSFAYEHAMWWYSKLKDVELMPVIKILRMHMHESWFGYSQSHKDKMNKELCDIAKEVIANMQKNKEL